jgi:hypothetical protein
VTTVVQPPRPRPSKLTSAIYLGCNVFITASFIFKEGYGGIRGFF